MADQDPLPETVSVALTGSGGAGVVTAGQMLLESAAGAGYYGLMGRSSGPQIRGGESAAFLRLSPQPVANFGDVFDIMIAFDWMNVDRFAAEIPLDGHSLVLCDPDAGAVPEVIAKSGARLAEVPLKATTKDIPGGRINMVGLGTVAALIGVPEEILNETLTRILGRKGEGAVTAGLAAARAGLALAGSLEAPCRLAAAGGGGDAERWNVSGNEGIGLGAIRGGVRFVAAYPITPATDALEWLAPNLENVGGHLVQAEDELASVNMIIGASFGGVPSLTATSGPGLALMMESVGLAVAAEVPIVVVDVMRGGPSTGIPTKSEQSDLNVAVYGCHGDAPHVVTAANSVVDCLFTGQWSVHLAESLQCPVIVLSDQSLGQSRAVVDRPADLAFVGQRETAAAPAAEYRRYAVTASGVSPASVPGTPGGEFVADGLEHNPRGTPSSMAEDHLMQLEKRQRKVTGFDYGDHWAAIDGSGELAVITWGSSTGPAREACRRAAQRGLATRLVSIRLLAPAQGEKFAAAMAGVKRALVVEQTHSQQFYRYLRAHYDLPDDLQVCHHPGPLPIRPGEITERLINWS